MSKLDKEISEKIPTDWNLLHLIDLSKNGISNGVFNDPEKRDKGYKLINVVDLYEEPYIKTKNLSLVDITEKEFEKNKAKYGDLFFTRSSLKLEGIAHCNILLSKKENITYDGHIMKLTPDEDMIDSLFLKYYCLSGMARNFFMRLAKHTTMTTIGQKDIAKLPVPIPNKKEQDIIVDIIMKWDEAISKTEKLIQAKKRYKKGLMQRLLSPSTSGQASKVRFPVFEGKDWVEVKLGELFSERKDKGYENLDLVAITTNKGVVDRNELDRRDTSSSNKSNYKRILPGDIGYNTMRMWQGVSGYSQIEGIVSPAYTIVVPIKEKVDGVFASYLFKYPPVIDLFRRYSQGLVSDTLNLKYKNFTQIKIKIPPTVNEQQQIASVFKQIDKEIALLHKKVESFLNQKKGLMQKLLTGKVRVNNLEVA